MLMIIVDGKEHGPYNDIFGTFITVGSSSTADVRLPWAASTSLTIQIYNDRAHFVTIHDPEGITHKGIFVSIGEPMTIMGHVITMMKA
jgi:hypothetical protein